MKKKRTKGEKQQFVRALLERIGQEGFINMTLMIVTSYHECIYGRPRAEDAGQNRSILSVCHRTNSVRWTRP